MDTGPDFPRYWHFCGTIIDVHTDAKPYKMGAAFREEVMYMIFPDLHKAYYALDRSRCFEILEGYGVVPRACRLLRTYWGRLTIVARAGGYYGVAFKGT